MYVHIRTQGQNLPGEDAREAAISHALELIQGEENTGQLWQTDEKRFGCFTEDCIYIKSWSPLSTKKKYFFDQSYNTGRSTVKLLREDSIKADSSDDAGGSYLLSH